MPRMRHGLRALAAGGLGLVVSLVAACGSNSGLLSSSDASSLSAQIQTVSADVTAGHCAAVPGDLNSLTQSLDNLPSSVNSTLRASLEQGVAQVRNFALQKCPSATASSTTTTSTATTRTTTSPTTTSTTPTHTTTTPATTTATTPSNPGTTTTGPGSGGTGLGDQGGNGGGGNGDGHGNGHHKHGG